MLVSKFASFLRLRNILLYRYIIFCFSILLTDGSVVKNPPVNAGDVGLILGWKDPLENEITAYTSIVALPVKAHGQSLVG